MRLPVDRLLALFMALLLGISPVEGAVVAMANATGGEHPMRDMHPPGLHANDQAGNAAKGSHHCDRCAGGDCCGAGGCVAGHCAACTAAALPLLNLFSLSGSAVVFRDPGQDLLARQITSVYRPPRP